MSDLISRQALLNKFNESKEIFDCATDDDIVITIRKDELSNCIAEVVNAPTVEERKHGRWEEDEDKDIYCTNCKHFLYPAEIRMQQITLASRRLKRKFCPECGAIMGEVNDG